MPISGCCQRDADGVSSHIFEDTGLNSRNLNPPI